MLGVSVPERQVKHGADDGEGHREDNGPDGGDKGGGLVCTGTPEEVAKCKASITGQYLKPKL